PVPPPASPRNDGRGRNRCLPDAPGAGPTRTAAPAGAGSDSAPVPLPRVSPPLVQATFGDPVRSKTDTALKNEVSGKFLCHNSCCVIREQCVLGIEVEVWPKEPGETPALRPLQQPGSVGRKGPHVAGKSFSCQHFLPKPTRGCQS